MPGSLGAFLKIAEFHGLMGRWRIQHGQIQNVPVWDSDFEPYSSEYPYHLHLDF